MDFADVVRRRRMVRRYDTRPLTGDVVERLLAAAVRGPSAGFTQGVELLALTSAGDRRRFWVSQSGEAAVASPSPWLVGMSAAPLVVAFLSSPEAYRARYAEADKAAAGKRQAHEWRVPYWDVDAGMAALLMLLAAVDEGLGACFFGLVEDGGHERFAAEFAVPDGWRCCGVVTAGHEATGDRPASSATTRRRRPLDDLVHRGTWGAH